MPGRERSRRGVPRSNPLGEDLQASRFVAVKKEHQQLRQQPSPGAEDDVEHDAGAFLIPTRTTQRILRTARVQLDEVRQDEATAVAAAVADEQDEQGVDDASCDVGLRRLLEAAEHVNEEQQEESTGEGDDGQAASEVELEYDDVESVVSELPATADELAEPLYDIDDEEARLLQKFQPPSRVQSRHLADLIAEKIKEKEEDTRAMPQPGQSSAAIDAADANDVDTHIDPRIARVYTTIGSVLKKYTSGKIPKAFKILPNIKNWEQLLMLTKPDQWSPHATYQATRIFAANLNEPMAQRFYAAVLLPVVHAHLLEERKLHPALYMAVRKALFKPVAFFKGFLLPLATDDECTLREALIIASVLQRAHLPPVPTAVTMVKIAQRPFSGPCSVFLRVLIDKKMALPYQAIDALVQYFHRFTRTHSKDEPLPVLWHQTLLSFVQRYKNDLTPAQLALLSQTCAMHFHYMITPEIRREISAAVRVRGGPGQQ